MHVMPAFDDRPDYSKRLEQARIARGFKSAKEAARRFGWVYESYIQHENGNRGIGRAAAKYAAAFKVSQGWLLTGEGKGPNDSTTFIDDFERLRHLEPEGFAELQDTFEVLLRDKLDKAERKRQQ